MVKMNTPQCTDDGSFAAVIFDMDGVVTDTAEAHFAAWKAVFDSFLAKHDKDNQDEDRPFSRQDYLSYVDGVPRHDGIRRFLRARGIELPEGEGDDAGFDTVRGLGNLKNRHFGEWLADHAVCVFDDAVEMIRALKATGLKTGIFSASRNAARVIESAGLRDTFDVAVDGADAHERGLAPKPAPDQLVETARLLGVTPENAVVVEDAVSGVEAGANGRFGLVIGVNRQQENPEQQRHALRANGADLVTRDLRQLLLPDGGGLKTLDRLPLVWDRINAFGERVKGRRLAVFLDFDGTLSPIVEDYRDATITDATRAAIRRLAKKWPVAIISGRDLADVRERVGIEDAFYAGSHGFDIAGPGGLQERPEVAEGFLDAIAAAGKALGEATSGIEGAKVERKSFSIAVHYREVAEGDVETLEKAVDQVVGDHEKLRKGRGKKVIEIQPRADWDKGRAVEWLLSHTRMGEGDALPLYLGDDLTDEDAFAALGARGLGIAVRGDGRATLADYALTNPDDVRRFLDWLNDHAEMM